MVVVVESSKSLQPGAQMRNFVPPLDSGLLKLKKKEFTVKLVVW